MPEEKRKFKYPEMLDHMEEKGIKFNIVTRKDARTMLATKNYYFKLTAYRKCFKKVNGKYNDLDFAYLTDLASIDSQLRYYILDISLDIEHALKTVLDDLITSDPAEDGYSVVTDFKNAFPTAYSQVMLYLSHSRYLRDLYTKHHEHMASWVFLETMTFGTLSRFLEFYFSKHPKKKLTTANDLLRYAKNLRNASAHNNPLIVNLFSSPERILNPSIQVIQIAQKMEISRKDVQDMKVNDLVCLFDLHKQYCSEASHEHVQRAGRRVLERMRRHSSYYAQNTTICRFIEIFKKLVDF